MDDLVARLAVSALYLWAAVEMARVGERASVAVRALLIVGSLAGAIWWAVLAGVDPAPSSLHPWWFITSRISQVILPVGVAVMGRRRREINGYH